MTNLPDEEIDHLLSRGGLGREDKERFLRGVLARVAVPAPVPVRRRSSWLWQAVAGLSLAGGVAVFALWGRPASETAPTLRAKGAPVLAPVVGMSCLGGTPSACPNGSRVAFWLEGPTKDAGFITVYAEPLGGGGRVWYLNNEATPVAASGPADAPRVITKAALIGREQPTGHYRVHAVVTHRPVDRADLPRLPPADIVTRANFDLVVSP
jgi:hypothetical protein